MAALLEIDKLSKAQQTQLIADLHVTHVQFIPGRTAGWQSTQETKAIDFYVRDADKRQIRVPYWYAGHFFNFPMFNRQRIFTPITAFDLIPGFELREYQKEVLDIAMAQYRKNGCCFFNVFCAFGKTVVATWLAYHFAKTNGLMTLITYPGTTVEESWLGTLKEFTNAKIFLIPTGHDFIIPIDTQVIVCSDGRLKKIPDKILDQVGHLVIDEADLFCTQSHVEGLLSVRPLVVTVLTATYERDDGMEKMLDLLVGPDRILRIDTKPFYVIKYESPFTSVNFKVSSRGKVWESIAKELSEIPERNLLICWLVLMNIKEKIIVLTYHIQHAKNLYGWISEFIKPYGGIVGLMVESDRTYDDCHILVGTFSKIGRGFDERKKCRNWGENPAIGKRRFNMVILAMSTKKIEQPAGRAGRSDEPILIDIVDSHDNTLKHWKHREKWYKERNGHIRTINNPYNGSWFNIRSSMVDAATREMNIKQCIQDAVQLNEQEQVMIPTDDVKPTGKTHLQAILERGYKFNKK